jgi:phage protein D
VQNPAEGTQQQSSNYTDRAYIQTLAQRYGYVFYVEPGPLPKMNRAYWGPPNRLDLPQSALSVNMGPNTNVESINFRYDALAPNGVVFSSEDTEQRVDSPSLRRLPLVRNRAQLRRTKYLSAAGGLSGQEARDRAQGMVDESLEEVVTASGELDALQYNGLLKARGLVDLRGAGQSYDGSYYVKSVTHSISKGEYKQRFTLTREGTGTLKPLVRT